MGVLVAHHQLLQCTETVDLNSLHGLWGMNTVRSVPVVCISVAVLDCGDNKAQSHQGHMESQSEDSYKNEVLNVFLNLILDVSL